MSRSILAALLVSVTSLVGCEGPKAAPPARVPYPPLPAERRFPVTLGAVTTSLDTIAKRTDKDLPNPAKLAADSDAKPLPQLATGSDGKVDLELAGPTYSGEPFEWSDYRGRVVIVLFWASDYPTCREDFSNLEKVRTFYRYLPLEVVAVNLDADVEHARKFLEVAQPSFPVIMDGEQDFDLLQKYPTRMVPFLVCVNKTGQIVDANFSDPRVNQHLAPLIHAAYTGPMADLPIPAGNGVIETEADEPDQLSQKTSKPLEKTETDSTGTNSKPLTEDEELTEAKVGVGKKGQGYGGDIYTEPLKARWRSAEKIVFDVKIPKAMSLFRATHDRLPKSHEEFMKEIIEENAIELPELPAGQEYIYLPEEGELMIRQPKK